MSLERIMKRTEKEIKSLIPLRLLSPRASYSARKQAVESFRAMIKSYEGKEPFQEERSRFERLLDLYRHESLLWAGAEASLCLAAIPARIPRKRPSDIPRGS